MILPFSTVLPPRQHLLNPRACTYLNTEAAACNPDVEVVAILKGLHGSDRTVGQEPNLAAIAAAAGPSHRATAHPLATVGYEEEGRGSAARNKVRKAWLHDAIGSDGACRFCGSFITSRNTTIRKKHLLNPKACNMWVDVVGDMQHVGDCCETC